MKLVLAIIGRADTDPVLDALTEGGYRATRLASTGGFLREGNATLIIGVEDTQVDHLVDLLRRTVRRRSGGNPGANASRGAVFVVPMTDSFHI